MKNISVSEIDKLLQKHGIYVHVENTGKAKPPYETRGKGTRIKFCIPEKLKPCYWSSDFDLYVFTSYYDEHTINFYINSGGGHKKLVGIYNKRYNYIVFKNDFEIFSRAIDIDGRYFFPELREVFMAALQKGINESPDFGSFDEVYDIEVIYSEKSFKITKL